MFYLKKYGLILFMILVNGLHASAQTIAVEYISVDQEFQSVFQQEEFLLYHYLQQPADHYCISDFRISVPDFRYYAWKPRLHPGQFDSGNIVTLTTGAWFKISENLSVIMDLPLYFYDISYGGGSKDHFMENLSISRKNTGSGYITPLIYEIKMGLGFAF